MGFFFHLRVSACTIKASQGLRWEQGARGTRARFIRQNLRLHAGLVFRAYTGCIICCILYSVYRVCIQAQTLCTYIYSGLYIYTRGGNLMLFFTLIFSKKLKSKAISECFLSYFTSMFTAVLLQNWRWGGKRQKPALWQIQQSVKYRPSTAVNSAWTLSSRCSSNTWAFAECCAYLLDNSLPPKESKLKHNTSIKGFFPGIYKQGS